MWLTAANPRGSGRRGVDRLATVQDVVDLLPQLGGPRRACKLHARWLRPREVWQAGRPRLLLETVFRRAFVEAIARANRGLGDALPLRADQHRCQQLRGV